MSNSHLFVLCIIAIVMCAGVFRAYLTNRYKRPEVDTELEEALEKVDVLEERIRVLERIVTENRFDLKKEIDQL
jgi:hypothetical protein